MATRTKWVAWGVAAILALVLLVAGVVLVADYQGRSREGEPGLALLAPGEWGFGRHRYAYFFTPAGRHAQLQEEWIRLGFFQVRTRRVTAAPPGPPASTR